MAKRTPLIRRKVLTTYNNLRECGFCGKRKPKPTHIEFYSFKGWGKKQWEIGYPGQTFYNKNTKSHDSYLIVLASHAMCGPETGYSISINQIKKEGLGSWYNHIKKKIWSRPGIVIDALRDVLVIYFPEELKLKKHKIIEVGPSIGINEPSNLDGDEMVLLSDINIDKTYIKGENKMNDGKVKFYKNGGTGSDLESWCVETTHTNHDNFLIDVSSGIASVLNEKDEFEREIILGNLLPKISEISAKLKGYKADVIVEQVIRAGNLPPIRNDMIWPTTEKKELTNAT